jgi:hypothetical protein
VRALSSDESTQTDVVCDCVWCAHTATPTRATAHSRVSLGIGYSCTVYVQCSIDSALRHAAELSPLSVSAEVRCETRAERAGARDARERSGVSPVRRGAMHWLEVDGKLERAVEVRREWMRVMNMT